MPRAVMCWPTAIELEFKAREVDDVVRGDEVPGPNSTMES